MIFGYHKADIIVFEWQVNPEFIESWFKKYNFTNYEIILVDCHEDTMAYRLTELRNQPGLVNQDMKNWLQFLRDKSKDLGIQSIDTSRITEKELIEIGRNMINKKTS